MIDGMAFRAQIGDQLAKKGKGIVERLQLGDLRADMHVDAGHLNTRQFSGFVVDFTGALPGNAELVFRLAGGNLGVGHGVHVGVDAQGHPRGPALFARHP